MKEGSFWIRFVLAALATWRVTHLLASEDGPADLIVRFRARLGHGLAGKLMDCFNCLSLWTAAPAALLVSRKPLDWLATWLALSGSACLLERLGHEPVVIQPVSQPAEGDVNDVLRSETIGAAERSRAGDSATDNIHSSAEGSRHSPAPNHPAKIPSADPDPAIVGEPPLLGELADPGAGSSDRPAV
jgi:hypothetical protein